MGGTITKLREAHSSQHVYPATLTGDNNRMDDITVDGDKFDAVLRRLIHSKPISKEEISAKIKA